MVSPTRQQIANALEEQITHVSQVGYMWHGLFVDDPMSACNLPPSLLGVSSEILRRSLLYDLLISMNRLMEPHDTGKTRKQFTFSWIIDYVQNPENKCSQFFMENRPFQRRPSDGSIFYDESESAGFDVQLKKCVDLKASLDTLWNNFTSIRNKIVAHSDLPTTFGGRSELAYEIQAVKDVLEASQVLAEQLHILLGLGSFSFDDCGGYGACTLLEKCQAGEDFRRLMNATDHLSDQEILDLVKQAAELGRLPPSPTPPA